MSGDSAAELLAAFTTVFFILAIGFGVERVHPFDRQTLNQLATLVVDVLLPIFLFYATATSTSPAALAAAPLLVLLGSLLTLLGLLLAVILGPLARVGPQQQPAFRFSAMVANTAFLGIPIAVGLYGSVGAVYGVLYDFGTTLVILTVGIWILSGGRSTNLANLVRNPLILAVVAGLLWALTGWQFPEWFARPCETVGNATLPLALLLSGAQLGSIRSRSGWQWRPVAALTAIRLLIVPLIAVAGLSLLARDEVFSGVVLVQAAMPVGLTTAIMARSYGADSEIPASAVLWSTLALVVTLPALVILFM